ncbi:MULTISPECIES: PilN domain-containing protein [Serratia]|uniref:PilN domain-containing protein n=1 Tax=Serratia TaxID=613 RepID=UPI001013C91E|nr:MULTISPECIES: PilN domain-containing protein [Serratia]CAI0967936.1 type II secretion system protein L [Serratia ficaria]CAI0980084.1 type II secretion system protein L [Serratia ficaria]CAI1726910.1 type II secretion system protein L [Serratia ficaria]CAI1905832.1 type II secretion system protein L [Serratia ficaria]CAI1953921.1 type II secretion system protein L [Serratia ficaria]
MYQVNLLPWRGQRQRRRGFFWLRMLALQLALVLLTVALVFSLLHGRQAQRQTRLEARADRLAALTQRYQQGQRQLAQLERQSARAEQRARNRQHNRRYLQLLQQLSAAVPPPLWLISLDGNLQEGLQLRGLSRHHAAIAQFEQRLAALPLLRQHRLAEVAQRQDGLFTFTLTAWGRDG